MKEYVYRIDGEPLHVYEISKVKRSRSGTLKQRKINWIIDLERQHDGKPLFNGPLIFDIEFHQLKERGKYAIFQYALVVKELFKNVVVNNQIEIVSFSAKRFSIEGNPYTLITLKEQKT